jgi:hypothetical protein
MPNLYGHSGAITQGLSDLITVIEAQFPTLVVTSTIGGNHASNSYHYRGEAVDMSLDSQTMHDCAEWIKSTGIYKQLAEGIHNPNLSVKNGQFVDPSFWGAATWAGHANHLHLAIVGPFHRPGAAPVPAGVLEPPVSQYDPSSLIHNAWWHWGTGGRTAQNNAATLRSNVDKVAYCTTRGTHA